MKTFITYLNEHQSNKEIMLDWPSSFNEQRALNEEWYKQFPEQIEPIHNDPLIKPTNLTDEQKEAIRGYAAAVSKDRNGYMSSGNINDYLRNKGGNKSRHITSNHNPHDVHRIVKILASAFTPENTNRKEITTYTGVPASIGNKLLEHKPGTKMTFSGFTSSSTNKGVARGFTLNYDRRGDAHHVLQLRVKKGAGLSIVDHALHSDENEVLIKHGALITYHRSETIPGNGKKKPIILHHITVHSISKPLEKYGEYTPKEE